MLDSFSWLARHLHLRSTGLALPSKIEPSDRAGMKRLAQLMIITTVFHLFVIQAVVAMDNVRTVAFAPFDPAFGFGFSYGVPLINDSGNTLFESNKDLSFVRESGNGTFATIATDGMVLPGNYNLSIPSRLPFLTDSNQAFFQTSARNPVSQAEFGAVFRHNGSLDALVQTSDEIPGIGQLPGVVVEDIFTPPRIDSIRFSTGGVSQNGQVAFGATVRGGFDIAGEPIPGFPSSGGVSGLFRASNNGFQFEALGLVDEDGVPLTGSGFNLFDFSSPKMNDHGMLVSSATQALPGLTEPEFSKVIVTQAAAGQSLSVRFREGDAAPGTGVDFRTLPDTMQINNSGQIGFTALLTGDSDRNQAVYNSGSLITRLGDAAPVVEEDITFARSFGQDGFSGVQLNELGQIAFIAGLAGEDISLFDGIGIFSEGQGNGLNLVARAGQTAPGTEAVFNDFSNLVLNDSGQVAFISQLSDGDNAFFAQDSTGELIKIVGEGDQIDVSDDPEMTDLRTIDRLTFFFDDFEKATNGRQGTGGQTYFNNRSELAFRALFDDSSSGVFVSNLIGAEGELLGDFDLDGDVDDDDIDFYSGNINQLATGALAALDLDEDGTITLSDQRLHVETLVETSNGQIGTFPGDFNLDGRVDVLGDAFVLIGNLGSLNTRWREGDLNADGRVDVLNDAFGLVANLGQNNGTSTAASTSAVPEPSGLMLFLALAGLGMTVRRQKAAGVSHARFSRMRLR